MPEDAVTPISKIRKKVKARAAVWNALVARNDLILSGRAFLWYEGDQHLENGTTNPEYTRHRYVFGKNGLIQDRRKMNVQGSHSETIQPETNYEVITVAGNKISFPDSVKARTLADSSKQGEDKLE